MVQSSEGKNATQDHTKIRSHVLEILRDDLGVPQGKESVLQYVGIQRTHVYVPHVSLHTIQPSGIGKPSVQSFPKVQGRLIL